MGALRYDHRAGNGDGPIARLKAYRLRVGTPCQAAATLAAMDYDVHLFTDAQHALGGGRGCGFAHGRYLKKMRAPKDNPAPA